MPGGPGRIGAEAGIDAGEEAIREAAEERISDLREAQAKGLPPPPPMDDSLTFGEEPWDAKTNPVDVPGAPAFVDTWVNGKIGRAKQHHAVKADPEVVQTRSGPSPPLFSCWCRCSRLLLKLAFVFRAIYMEIWCGPHSNAFISLCVDGVRPAGPSHLALADSFLHDLAGWGIFLLCAWMPIYLLLMQKRVYAQGWPMTVCKFGVLGTIYMVLLSFGIAAAAAASLVWM